MNSVESQLAEYFELQEELYPEITSDEVTGSPVRVTTPARPSSGMRWAIAAAAITVLVIGGTGLLARIITEPDSSPVADDPVVTTTQPATTSTIATGALDEPRALQEEAPVDGGNETPVGTPWLIEEIPPDADSGVFDTPVGTASWVKLPVDEDTLPNTRCHVYDEDDGYGGCQSPGGFMPWPSGFAMFQGSRSGYPPPVRPEVPAWLWTSVNGVEWQEQALPSDPFATGISLTLDNGVYWLLSEEPAALWYTTDGSTWHEVDPTGLAPPGSVGPTWERSYTPPVTAGDLTVTYGSFNGDDYPDDHEQGLYIISNDNVTRTEVPWPTVVGATLFSTGDWIYAYTVDSQSRDATVTVWRTRDGRSWTEIGTPGFVDASGLPGKTFYLYSTLDGPLVAWSYELRGSAWETVDGLNWGPADLPPLPSTNSRFATSPLRLGTGWFAVTGSQGGELDGDTWWLKADDSWFPLTELQLSGMEMKTSGFGNTTFFSNEQAIWVMNLNTTE